MKYLPNILTVFRIILTVVFLMLIFKEGFFYKSWAVFVFTLASITDFLDGYLARKYRIISNFGKLMDPIADKFLMLSTFYVFVVINIMPKWMFFIIFMREIGITLFRFFAKKKGLTLAAEGLGKFKTVAQIVTAFVVLIYIMLLESGKAQQWVLQSEALWLSGIFIVMLITVGLTLLSGGTYLWNNRKILCQINS